MAYVDDEMLEDEMLEDEFEEIMRPLEIDENLMNDFNDTLDLIYAPKVLKQKANLDKQRIKENNLIPLIFKILVFIIFTLFFFFEE